MAYTTINKGSSYFNTVLYTGNGTTQSITTVDFQPDFTWLKCRSSAYDHRLYDVIRGATKSLRSNTTQVEQTDASEGITSFLSNGFTVQQGANLEYNATGQTYVGWNWLASNTTTANTSGSISSTVSVNTTAGFSVVSYTGTGVNATIGHGLGVAPKMMIVKNRSAVAQWEVYHVSTGNTSAMQLSGRGAPDVASTYWNNTSPTSTLFSIGTGTPTNGSGNSIIAYCFSEVKGYSKFGSYTGNGSTDGTFIYTGFKPAYVMIKRSDTGTTGWAIWDTSRNTYNVVNNLLLAEDASAELNYPEIDILSNGFKLRGTNVTWNQSGSTQIYSAFAQNPFVTSGGIPTTAR